ncbi:type IV toxin-antitoxin system AbiEi family antitoxin domain-containing protein [Gordonia sp. SL306]|uniref:type IV toxin-antitoxin system AbiEi family antitoxin domain-containing protein n=1 Tax=Gordonia sp. SL306 TaxID=2995145 RepID=UPI00226EE77A|nr:type IV toxin-antitoxin system AbiEi family antitoxin domain-containing protein [Gordonia sp. SL306]WAC53569.1 type IV toxin-antitoxin system AbiEi family antitoxin domain-containing protein [Gordonia sp. SL306]
MDFDTLIARFGGVVSTRQLIRVGYDTEAIRAAADDGTLIRLRHGWYAVAAADAEVVAVVEGGCLVTCASALRHHGLWVPEGYDGLHARLTRYGRRHAPDSCRRYGRPTPADGAIDDVATSLQYAARCLDEEGFVIVCDSAMNLGKITPDDLVDEFRRGPESIRRLVDKCDRRAASGTETAARLRLRAAGLNVLVQHEVPDVGWVDLLVGECLAVELDSRDHHTGVTNYESDRRRDRLLIADGYIPLRLTYGQVFRHWDTTYADIARIIRKRIHRRRTG